MDHLLDGYEKRLRLVQNWRDIILRDPFSMLSLVDCVRCLVAAHRNLQDYKLIMMEYLEN